jgi:hypothetical protein
LIRGAGNDGLVIVLAAGGETAAVYMMADERLWQFRMVDNVPVPEPWSRPSALSSVGSPRRVLAFTHCGDPILPSPIN